jgi:hypothetical protein
VPLPTFIESTVLQSIVNLVDFVEADAVEAIARETAATA